MMMMAMLLQLVSLVWGVWRCGGGGGVGGSDVRKSRVPVLPTHHRRTRIYNAIVGSYSALVANAA